MNDMNLMFPDLKGRLRFRKQVQIEATRENASSKGTHKNKQVHKRTNI
jgi:hypothetical protein